MKKILLYSLFLFTVPALAQELSSTEKMKLLAAEKQSVAIVDKALEGTYVAEELTQANELKKAGVSDEMILHIMDKHYKLTQQDIADIKQFQDNGYPIATIAKTLKEKSSFSNQLKNDAKEIKNDSINNSVPIKNVETNKELRFHEERNIENSKAVLAVKAREYAEDIAYWKLSVQVFNSDSVTFLNRKRLPKQTIIQTGEKTKKASLEYKVKIGFIDNHYSVTLDDFRLDYATKNGLIVEYIEEAKTVNQFDLQEAANKIASKKLRQIINVMDYDNKYYKSYWNFSIIPSYYLFDEKSSSHYAYFTEDSLNKFTHYSGEQGFHLTLGANYFTTISRRIDFGTGLYYSLLNSRLIRTHKQLKNTDNIYYSTIAEYKNRIQYHFLTIPALFRFHAKELTHRHAPFIFEIGLLNQFLVGLNITGDSFNERDNISGFRANDYVRYQLGLTIGFGVMIPLKTGKHISLMPYFNLPGNTLFASIKAGDSGVLFEEALTGMGFKFEFALGKK